MIAECEYSSLLVPNYVLVLEDGAVVTAYCMMVVFVIVVVVVR